MTKAAVDTRQTGHADDRMALGDRLGVTRRTMALGGAAGGLIALATGCGGPSPSEPAATAQPVKITYMMLQGGGTKEHQLTVDLFDSFNRSQQRVIVEVEGTGSSSWGVLKEKFVVRHTGGDPADLVINNWGTWKDMSDGGMLTELTPFVKRDKIDLNRYLLNNLGRCQEVSHDVARLSALACTASTWSSPGTWLAPERRSWR